MGQVLAVANQKGGVGKSAAVGTLAGMYAQAGHRVLVIDLDPQGNLTEAFGLVGNPAVDDGGAALADAIITGTPLRPASAGTPSRPREGLYIVGGGPAVVDVYAHMLRTFDEAASPDNTVLAASTAYWLRRCLDPVIDDFDLIIIDCPPGIEQLQVLALTAADFALFPVGTDLSERKGVRLIADVFAHVRDTTNPDLELVGIVAMRVKRSQERTALADLRERIAADFAGNPNILFDAWIAEAAAAAVQARSRGLLVHELDDDSRAATTARIAALRAGRKPGSLSVPGSVAGLSGDYANVAVELSARMSILADGGTLADLNLDEVHA